MPGSILVTGADGQLGTELRRLDWPDGFDVVGINRDVVDLADHAAIAAFMAGSSFAAVINGAAYTAVDLAETEVAMAWAVNALAPAALAQACARSGTPMVQVSTDYVFPGDKDGAWDVDDRPAPLGVYGASKLGGEFAVRTSGARHAIVRTAWVMSPHGRNFVKTMLRAAAHRDTVRVVDDQFGSPTAAADLARAIAQIAIRLAEDSSAPTGTFHFSNSGGTSWAGVATEIFEQSRARGGPVAMVEPIATADFATIARRPANSLLSHRAIGQAYGIEPRPWQEALADIMNELIGDDR